MFTSSTSFHSRMVQVVALTAVLAAAPSIVWAQDRPWTTVGSAGTVDEESLLFVTLTNATARVTEWAPAGTIGVIRYNVVAVEDFFRYPGMGLRARFFDREETDRVLIRLRQIEMATGAIDTLVTMDSNDYPASDLFQVESRCGESVQFDFGRYAYYIEVGLTKSKGPRRGLPPPGPQLLLAPAISMVQIVPVCLR